MGEDPQCDEEAGCVKVPQNPASSARKTKEDTPILISRRKNQIKGKTFLGKASLQAGGSVFCATMVVLSEISRCTPKKTKTCHPTTNNNMIKRLFVKICTIFQVGRNLAAKMSGRSLIIRKRLSLLP